MSDDKAANSGFKVPSVPARRTAAAPANSEPAHRPAPPLSYTPPSNAHAPQRQYTLEAVKDGSVVESRNVATTKSFFTFGRLPVCDYPMDHASISRYHAVLQFTDGGNALSIIDLGSSHGTFVNKRQILARTPCQVDIGDQIRFGMSSRIWII
ncbi:SMAD/FHA domain-containing protein, partial [Martensiomyces pterosporus]